MQDNFVSGFVSILGRPNAGKSTLLNALIGAKVAIVSDKPQTTRTLVQGVVTRPGAQIVFVDTPGIHDPDSLFNRRMMESIRSALDQRDLLLFAVDASAPPRDSDSGAIEVVRRSETPVILVLTKIDRVKPKQLLLPVIERYRTLYDFADYVPVSALKKEGLDDLLTTITARLPQGPAYFPEDYLTDQPERFLAAELIREKVLEATRQEVPHATAVMVDSWEEGEQLTRIAATIYVERDGQKGIVIGAGGATLKTIGTQARIEIEAMLERKVFLELFVKVKPGWRENRQFLDELDWRTHFAGGTAADT